MPRGNDSSLFVVALPQPAPTQPAAVFLPRPQTASSSRPRISNRTRTTEIIINPTTAAPESNQDQAIPSFIQVGPKSQTTAATVSLTDVETVVPEVEIAQSERAQAEQAVIDEEEGENDKCSRYVVIGVLVFFAAFLGGLMILIHLSK